MLKMAAMETNKNAVYKELGIDNDLSLVTYASAGEKSVMKPGGSFSPEVVECLRDISRDGRFNVLIKEKYAKFLKSKAS
jgi:hypothetical protein